LRHFSDEVRSCLTTNNYYAALSLALTLPDIAGWIRSPEDGSRRRYTAWWNEYVLPQYRGLTEVSGSDAYALRCAFLHAGSDITENQRAAEAIRRFKIVQPVVPNISIHMNQMDNSMNIQVDAFCMEILNGLDRFYEDLANDSAMAGRADQLATIQFLDPRQGFRL
jgi:hypothetical protein